LDYIEELEGTLNAYEIKWNPKSKARLSKTFTSAYNNTTYKVIYPENFKGILIS
jgi:hypothetical protein